MTDGPYRTPAGPHPAQLEWWMQGVRDLVEMCEIHAFWSGFGFAWFMAYATFYAVMWTLPPRFNKPPAKVCTEEVVLVGSLDDGAPTDAEIDAHEQRCEATCMSIRMWPIAAQVDDHLRGWSTCTCIPDLSREPEPVPTVVVFRGEFMERAEIIYPGGSSP